MVSHSPVVEGRFQLVDGVPFYSPNSAFDAPLYLDSSMDGMNPFQPRGDRRSDIRYGDLLRPRRWQKAFYWIAFIPTDHWYKYYRLPPFHHLGKVPPIQQYFTDEESAYCVSPDNPFTVLEDEVYRAVVALKNKFELPCVLPFLPNALGYLGTYRKRAQLVQVLQETREWFSVWLGALSYCIAMADTRQWVTKELKFTGYPNWRKVLMEEGFSEGWIDDVVRSPVGQYLPQYPRVGCILEIVKEHPDQPMGMWFANHSVPVWWRWGPEEEAYCKQWNMTWYLPQSPPPAKESPTVLTERPKTPLTCKEPEWIAFFQRREDRYSHITATESRLDRQRRENRTRDRPVRTAKVFEWLESYDEPNTWKRTPVTQKCKLDTFELYRNHQMRYDPFFNEWDLCEHFCFGGGDDAYDTDSDSERGEELPPPPVAVSSSPPPTPHSAAIPPPLTALTSRSGDCYPNADPPPDLFRAVLHPSPPAGDNTTPSTTLPSPACPIQQEVEDIFGGYYGFCAPVIGTDFPDLSYQERSADWFRRLLGLLPDETYNQEYFTTPHYLSAQLFLDSNVGNKPPHPSLSDLEDSALRPVRLLPRFPQIIRVSLRNRISNDDNNSDCADFLYVLKPSTPSVPWKIACFSPITALYICRLPSEYTETSIAFHLSQRGVSFRVLSPPPRLRRPMHARVVHELPIRRQTHRFTKEDYESYVNQRTYLLGQPHMQAAIRRGGIAWRLAIATLGIADVVREPTLWGDTFSPTADLVEDTLSKVELDLLCGAYECISDDGKQRTLKSWWPLVRYYEKEECGENQGHWSNRRESWYGDRLLKMQNPGSEVQPLSYTEWKSKLHGVKAIRTFTNHITKQSATLLGTRAITITPP
ncbi:hypothetical protein MD484_g8123, partial [Candolleomyces efflorescens]